MNSTLQEALVVQDMLSQVKDTYGLECMQFVQSQMARTSSTSWDDSLVHALTTWERSHGALRMDI